MMTVSPQNRTAVRVVSKVPVLTRLAMGLGGWIAPVTTGRRAELIFSRPFPSSRQRALDTPLEGAKVSRLQVAGESVTVYRWGDPSRQPLLLFSHGWSSFGLRVLPWLEPLRAAGYAVASFDQVAHGRSSGRHATLPGFGSVLAEVARQIGPIDSFIGHSLGAAAVALALADGVKARRVVLIAPPADAGEAAGRFAHRIGLGDAALPVLQHSAEARAGVPFSAISAQNIAPRLSVPALIVHDLDDREVPWSEGERYARYWPEARLLTRRGLGHHRIVADPDVIAAGLRFLSGEAQGVRVVSSPNLPFGLA